MKRFLSSPLVHFAVLGTLAFIGFRVLRGSSIDENRRIEVTEQDVGRLRDAFAAQWRRPPTERELQGLIDNHIKEEVLYREALAMGLDRDDVVIRRRLAQKIEFLADDLVTRAEPTPQELEQFLAQNLDRYEIPGRVSFSHVYFSIDRRGESAADDALDALRRIRAGASPDALGDPFMLQREYPSRSKREVADLFGSDFADALFEVESDAWEGPVSSSYGVHLVRITERTSARSPKLGDVSDRVRNDLLAERRREANDALMESLKARYEIVVQAR